MKNSLFVPAPWYQWYFEAKENCLDTDIDSSQMKWTGLIAWYFPPVLSAKILSLESCILIAYIIPVKDNDSYYIYFIICLMIVNGIVFYKM